MCVCGGVRVEVRILQHEDKGDDKVRVRVRVRVGVRVRVRVRRG